MSDRPLDIHIDELALDGEPPDGLDAEVSSALRRLMDPTSTHEDDGHSATAQQIAEAIYAQLPPAGDER